MNEDLLPSQCRMARAALDWTALQLAQKAGIGVTTVSRFESGLTGPTRATLAAMKRALETAGVIFIAENGQGAGVRLRKETVQPTCAKLSAP